jgi:O-antigen/teichoic acid export membrane protein
MSEVVEHELVEGDVPSERSLARDVSLNVGARLFAMACSSVTALLVANALTRHQYGAYAIVVGINVILVMALDLGMTSSLARYVAQGRGSTRLVVSVALTRLAIIGVAALFVLAAKPFAGDDGPIGDLLPMLALLVIAQSLIAFHFGALPSLRRIRLLLLVTVLQPAGELALVLVARANDGGPEQMLLATALSALAVSALAWIILLAPGRAAAKDVPDLGAAERATMSLVYRYGLSIFLVSLLIAVFGQVDQFVIGAFHPLSQVAPYALVLKLQALVSAISIAVAGIVAPRIAGAGIDALRLYRDWLGFLLVLGLGEVAVLATLSGEAFGTIGGQYRGDSHLLVGMGLFLLLTTVAPLPTIALNQTGHAKDRLRIAGITVAINITLDFALVPWLGAWGAVIATTLAYAYYFVHHHRLLQETLRADALQAPPRMDHLVIKGILVAILGGAIAAFVRHALGLAGYDSDVVVLLVAGALGALPILWTASRLVRHDSPAAADS